jgi:hypothetical protein
MILPLSLKDIKSFIKNLSFKKKALPKKHYRKKKLSFLSKSFKSFTKEII